MTCGDWNDLLQERLDGGPALDRPGLEPHLAACPMCRERHAAAHRFEEALRLLAPPSPPAGLACRITARILVERQARLRHRHRLVRAAAAVAAAVALVFLSVHDGPAPPEARPPAVAENHPAPPPPAGLRDSVAEAGSAVVNLTRRTADDTVGQGRLLVPVVVATPPDTGGPLPAGHPLREAGQGVSTGLDPVTDSARRALDLFLRDIPPMGSDAKQGS